jgi:hypothetical protein
MLEMIGLIGIEPMTLFHAITTIASNLLILGASVATKSILEHPKPTLSTLPAPLRSQKRGLRFDPFAKSSDTV